MNLTGVTFEEALDRLTFVNRLFYKVVDQNTLIIVPESRQKRVAYDELLLRTFYVQNAEINDTVNLVKTLAKITTVGRQPEPRGDHGARHRGPDRDGRAHHRGERQGARRGGGRGADPRGEPQRRSSTGGSTSRTTRRPRRSRPPARQDEVAGGLLNIRAHLLSSLNQADWVVSIPSTIFARFLAERLHGRASSPRRGCARRRARRPS